MPKNKTHSGMKKRVKVTGSGKLLFQRAGKRHLLEHKSSTLTRRLTGTDRVRRGRRAARQEAARPLSRSHRHLVDPPPRPAGGPNTQGITVARVKRAVNAHKKRRTTLEAASGYRGQRSRLYRKAKEQLLHSATYSYRDRKARKGDFRQLWITRINAAARANDMTYNRFIQGLRLAGVEVDRKVLADLAVTDEAAFAALVEVARAAVAAEGIGGAAAAEPGRLSRSTLLSDSNARLAAARRLTSRRGRRDAGRFLAEGPQAVTEALRVAGVVSSCSRPPRRSSAIRDWSPLRRARRRRVDVISAKAAAALSETVTPQGLVAVCRHVDRSLADGAGRAAAAGRRAGRDQRPGQRRHDLRAADAAGADAVIFAGGVDPYNGKAVRASAGSLFHLDVVADVDAR